MFIVRFTLSEAISRRVRRDLAHRRRGAGYIYLVLSFISNAMINNYLVHRASVMSCFKNIQLDCSSL